MSLIACQAVADAGHGRGIPSCDLLIGVKFDAAPEHQKEDPDVAESEPVPSSLMRRRIINLAYHAMKRENVLVDLPGRVQRVTSTVVAIRARIGQQYASFQGALSL